MTELSLGSQRHYDFLKVKIKADMIISISFCRFALKKYKSLFDFSLLLALACLSSHCSALNLEENNSNMLEIKIGEETLLAEFADTNAASALRQKLAQGDFSVNVSPYGGFEVFGSLPVNLPQSDQRLTAQLGDIMLYQGNSIVLFYGTNTWSYTKLAHIISHTPAELSKVLKNARVIKLSIK